MQLVINASFGLAVGTGLWLMAVPYSYLWGLSAFVLRYIPYVGPWIAALLPIAVSVVHFEGWTMVLLVVGLFVVLELFTNNILEPWLYGQSVGLSPVAVIIAAGLLPEELWPATASLGVFVVALHALSGTSSRLLVRRTLQFLPMVLALSLAAVWSRPDADAALWSVTLLLRCLVAFLAGLWLMQTLTAAEFLDVLSRWRAPVALTVILNFLLRYVALLWEEHERMLRAQRARAGGPAEPPVTAA